MMAGSETSTGLDEESESVIQCSIVGQAFAVPSTVPFAVPAQNQFRLEIIGILDQMHEVKGRRLFPVPVTAGENTRRLGAEIRVKHQLPK